MLYQVVSLTSSYFSALFHSLKEAKLFVLKYCPNDAVIIRHRKNGSTKRITYYYPKFGFETETVKHLHDNLVGSEPCLKTKALILSRKNIHLTHPKAQKEQSDISLNP